MNTNPDFEKEGALLNAVLGDESWQTTNAACKVAAVEAFRTRQRGRRVMRWTGCVLAVAAAVISGVFWRGPLVPPPPQIAAKPPNAPKETLKSRYLTDAELVASFPEGSCFLAEIDGKKKLVFLDQEVERHYLSKASDEDSLAR